MMDIGQDFETIEEFSLKKHSDRVDVKNIELRNHNPEVGGSSPSPATKIFITKPNRFNVLDTDHNRVDWWLFLFLFISILLFFAPVVAQVMHAFFPSLPSNN